MVQQRYVLCGMMFFGLAVALGLRISFSLVLTQMVFIPNTNQSLYPNDELICPIKSALNETTNAIVDERGDRFQWSQKLQGVILSSFYWGFLVSEIPSGVCAQKYGAKSIMLIGIFLSAIVAALTPMAVTYGSAYGLIATRVLIGFLHGPLQPCSSLFIIAWFPIEQRGRFNALITMGIGVGGFLSSYFAGVMINYTGRWDVVFYYLAAVTVLWCILFALLCYERPQIHPYISDKEKLFLQQRIHYLEDDKTNLLPTPWWEILTSRGVIALAFSSALFNWAFNVVSTDLPKYMNDVLHISVQKNAVYSSLPKILSIIISLTSGFLSDWMFEKGGISLTKIRKWFATLASVFSAIFLIAASYSGCDELLVVLFFILSIGSTGLDSAGTMLNMFDLAANYIGPLTGIINSISTIAGMLSPYIVGVLTPHAYLSEWRTVFWLTFALHITKVIIFTTWGTAKIQPWDAQKKAQSDESK